MLGYWTTSLATGALGLSTFHKVSKPETLLPPKLGRRKLPRRNNYFLSGIWTTSSDCPSCVLQCRQWIWQQRCRQANGHLVWLGHPQAASIRSHRRVTLCCIPHPGRVFACGECPRGSIEHISSKKLPTPKFPRQRVQTHSIVK